MSSDRKDIVVAIHQPNLFPWLGYFNKIARSDIFVFMDDVAYPKSGSGMGSWVNRVRILIQGRSSWLSCPLTRAHGIQLIKDIKMNPSVNHRKKILKTIELNYRKARYFEDIFGMLEKLILRELDGLAEYNIANILALCEKLNLGKQFMRQSLLETKESSTELLIEIAHKTGSTAYLSGDGSSGYLDSQRFTQSGLKLFYQDFKQPSYKQFRDDNFIPGLSIIDVLMNCGYEKTRSLVMGEN